MKWGRKKNSSNSSPSTLSRPSFISHVFPISWLSKFKQKSSDVEAKAVQVKRDGKRNTVCISSPTRNSAGRGRFYGGEDDAFWRLSFGEEGVEGKSSRGVMSSVWYDSREEFDVPPSTCQSCRSRATTVMGKEEIDKFNNLILDARKMRELKREVEILPEMDTCRSGQETLTKPLRVVTEKERKLKKINPRLSTVKRSELKRNSNEADENPRNSVEKCNLEFETLRTIQRMQRENCKLTNTDLKKQRYVSPTKSKVSNFTTEEGVIAAQSLNACYGISSAEKMSSEWEKLKKMKIRELKSKSENRRKSLYTSRELQGRRAKQNNKVRVSSPRIKALEDMKKAKQKMKGKEKTMEGRIGLESFAVAKCSFDPQKDFTDSMHEMIMEKKINQPEELEELLSCYLTLNPDEYHDLIIKVFRQVWFDLNQTCFDNEFQEEKFHN